MKSIQRLNIGEKVFICFIPMDLRGNEKICCSFPLKIKEKKIKENEDEGKGAAVQRCSGNCLSYEENKRCFYLIYDSCAATGTFQKQIVAAVFDRVSEAFSWASA